MKRTLDSRIARGEEYYMRALAKAADKARPPVPKGPAHDLTALDFKMLVARLKAIHTGDKA